jgi:hypothetical protein
MTAPEIRYERAPVPVRADLPAAHARTWQRLACAGRWWSGAERVALAAEVRAAAGCRLCRERRDALSPGSVAGAHDASGRSLPAAAVEAAHRIATDPGRLSRRFYDDALAGGLSDGQYVELVGVVASVVSIDAFCRGLGVPLHALPEPEPGTPSRERPPGLGDCGAWVPMTPGGLGLVLRALSLAPEEVANQRELSAAHYMRAQDMIDLAHGTGALDRAQVELVAARISALRECFY